MRTHYVRVGVCFRDPVCVDDDPGGFRRELCTSARNTSLWVHAKLINGCFSEEHVAKILEHAASTFPNTSPEENVAVYRVQAMEPALPQEKILFLDAARE